MLILSTGGKGTGVEADGSNFPFVQPGPDIRGLLADLWLSHEYRDVVVPLRVIEMTGFQNAFDGLASAATIKIADANDATIFDSTGARYYWKPWGTRFRIHEWLFPGISVCRVVQHRAVPEPRAPWPDTIVPDNGVLDERTSELLPKRLMFLSTPGVEPVQGKIQFHNGFNVEIRSAPYPEALRNTTALTFSADPGKGLGRAPGCQDPVLFIRGINGTGPDPQGNLSLAAGACYYVRQPVNVGDDKLAVPVPATLDVGNDCDPCCDCDSYVNVQRAILNIEAGLRAAAKIAEDTRDEFTVAKERWNAQKECREQQAVSITVVTTGRFYADINVTICNVTSQCMVDTKVHIDVHTQPPGSWSVVPSTSYVSQAGQGQMIGYQLFGEDGGLTGWIPAINPMSAGRIRTRLVWSAQRPEGTTVTVTATASTPGPSDLFPQSATTTTLMT